MAGEKGQQILHFREAFHGRSGYTLSLTNTDPKKTELLPQVPLAARREPEAALPGHRGGGEATWRAAEQRALEQVKKAFEDNPDDIAAIIIEPIQAEGGDNHFRPEFLQALERLADENECFFIVDEVQTGIGLTGKMWAHEHFGLTPDALAFGKKMQICGCLVGPKVDQEPENVFKVSSRINSTWGGGLTDMVRSGRYLEIDRRGPPGRQRARGRASTSCAACRACRPSLGGLMSNARGRGLMIAFDLPTPELREKAHETLIENGLLLLTCGPRSIRFRPPLNLTRGGGGHRARDRAQEPEGAVKAEPLKGVPDDRARSRASRSTTRRWERRGPRAGWSACRPRASTKSPSSPAARTSRRLLPIQSTVILAAEAEEEVASLEVER